MKPVSIVTLVFNESVEGIERELREKRRGKKKKRKKRKNWKRKIDLASVRKNSKNQR